MMHILKGAATRNLMAVFYAARLYAQITGPSVRQRTLPNAALNCRAENLDDVRCRTEVRQCFWLNIKYQSMSSTFERFDHAQPSNRLARPVVHPADFRLTTRTGGARKLA